MSRQYKKFHIIYSTNNETLKDIQTEFGSQEAIIKHSVNRNGIMKVFYELRTNLTVSEREFLKELYGMKKERGIRGNLHESIEYVIAE